MNSTGKKAIESAIRCKRPHLKHPTQPVVKDNAGVHRFKGNAIVQYLIDHGGIDMNHLARLHFSAEDRQQFAQLIGYSVSGYSELSYVDSAAYRAACKMEAKCVLSVPVVPSVPGRRK